MTLYATDETAPDFPAIGTQGHLDLLAESVVTLRRIAEETEDAYGAESPAAKATWNALHAVQADLECAQLARGEWRVKHGYRPSLSDATTLLTTLSQSPGVS